MRDRKFFLSCTCLLAAITTAASLFGACAAGADFDDDSTDGGDSGVVTDATPGTSSSGAATSSSGAATSSSGAATSSSSGAPADCKVVINEISMGSNDWVELYNPTGCDDVDLSTYELIYRSAGNSNDIPLFEGDDTALGGGEFFVIGVGGDVPWKGGTTPLGAAGGQLALKDGSSVDEVAYGTADGDYGEGDNAPTTSTDSIQRIPDGTDTDDNSADFVVSSPTKGSPNE